MERELKLGAKIAALRKAKGLTQGQLAEALGVSPAAVSKWETGSSYPDLALLCPLARALDTDPDQLLGYEETLSEEQIAAQISQVMDVARAKGAVEAEGRLEKLLHRYPSCTALQYNAAAVYTVFSLLSSAASPAEAGRWKERRYRLLQDVRGKGTGVYWQAAVSQLASLAAAEGKTEEAEALLQELPEQTTDPTLCRTQLYLARGETGKARETVQKRLYTLVCQVQSCLMQLLSEALTPDTGRALEICEICRQTEELFGCGSGLSGGLFLELYLRSGQPEKALACLSQYVNVITGPAKPPKPLLFSPALDTEPGGRAASTKEIRRLFLRGLQEEEAFAPFRESEVYRAAVKKLEESCWDS